MMPEKVWLAVEATLLIDDMIFACFAYLVNHNRLITST
jgi:hypothetical protein